MLVNNKIKRRATGEWGGKKSKDRGRANGLHRVDMLADDKVVYKKHKPKRRRKVLYSIGLTLLNFPTCCAFSYKNLKKLGLDYFGHIDIEIVDITKNKGGIPMYRFLYEGEKFYFTG